MKWFYTLLMLLTLSLTACAQGDKMPQENRQLIVFTAPDCSVCKQFKHEITDHWQAEIAIQEVSGSSAPSGLTLGDF